jgi:hypothetical protein
LIQRDDFAQFLADSAKPLGMSLFGLGLNNLVWGMRRRP